MRHLETFVRLRILGETMKHYITKEVPAQPATTEQRLDKTTCDLCGAEIKKERFSAEEVEVKHRTGENYPEGGSGEETCFDICGKCFDEKLTTWFEEQGAKPQTSKWDW